MSSRNLVQQSIVEITSSDDTKLDRHGTGFVIYRDQQSTYIATCAHVVNEVGGEGKLKVDDKDAKILVSEEQADLAVLQVDALDKQQVRLINAGNEGVPCFIHGCRNLRVLNVKAKSYVREIGSIHGTLYRSVLWPVNGSRTQAWEIRIDPNENLDPGYSGSPVVIERDASNYVIAIMRLRRDSSEGRAISVEALNKIWQKIPSEVFSNGTRPDLFADYLRITGIDYTQLRDYLAQRKWEEADFETAFIMLHRASLQTNIDKSKSQLEILEEFIEKSTKTIGNLFNPKHIEGLQRFVENKYVQRGAQISGSAMSSYVKLAFLLGSGYNIKRLENFPLQDLNIINDLWINYSGG
ncbi:trypsin-like peptidase domain-containing protein, partial [Cyanobacteria bacterium FACHB-502]|nr:trypsin-like peptidase domain-containing protein [Cyanobacteria bacterium FACHB-502]